MDVLSPRICSRSCMEQKTCYLVKYLAKKGGKIENTHVLSVRTHVLSVRAHVLSVRTHVLRVRTHVLSVRTHVLGVWTCVFLHVGAHVRT